MGRSISHLWSEANVAYRGTIISYSNPLFLISYHRDADGDEEDFSKTKFDIGVDYINNDLHFL